jgi:2-dehydro-3-deoxyphosphogluconate aldolase/(4S)-4-hydroxy-2-oxoglutarate aldolase
VTGDELRAELAARGVVAVLRAASAQRAVAAARALAEGGVTAIEVTFTVPDAGRAIAELTQDEELLVGAGTVLTAAQASTAADARAQFLVSPNLDEQVLDAAGRLGVPALPGVLTPTELARAARRCSLVKLFPASLGGPGLLAALRGPFPGVGLVPTGGVSASNISDWLAAGAVAVGAGAELCPAGAIEAGDTDLLRARAEEFIGAFQAARAG